MVCLGQGAIWSGSHLGVVHLGSLPAAGAWVVAWLGAGLAHSSDFLGLGNRSCWAQGHFELAQGPPLLSLYRIQRRQTHFSPSGRGRQLCGRSLETWLAIALHCQLTWALGTPLILAEPASVSTLVQRWGCLD